MNFGFNLPGPFRVGVSSKGRVTGGVSVGPFSVSGQLGTPVQGGLIVPVSLEQLITEAEAEGWKVAGYRPGAVARVERGLRAISLRVVPGGVLMRRIAGTRLSLLWLGVATLLVVGFCALGQFG